MNKLVFEVVLGEVQLKEKLSDESHEEKEAENRLKITSNVGENIQKPQIGPFINDCFH